MEQFARGADGGRDLRATIDAQLVIGQAKHYMQSGYSKLQSSLSEELKSLKKMQPQPDRYIVFTSVPLTPARKTAIRELLSPYVKADSDVWGLEDIEGVIGQNPSIESNHYKLWLSSAQVLQRILSTSTDARSKLRIESVLGRTHLFVAHEQMAPAQRILAAEHCLIISGAPGIGKTTLAEMLAMKLAEAEHSVYFVTSVSEVEQLLVRDEKQAIIYDDFLGRTNFREAPDLPHQERLFEIMREMRGRANRYFILTTREYIYQEARFVSERISQDQAEVYKCVLNAGGYARLDKAAILYNHLFWSDGLKSEDLRAFVASRGYLPVIRHRHFNPRWIADTVAYLTRGSGQAPTGEH